MSEDWDGPTQRPYGSLLSPQESPRALHLMPEGLFLPAGVLRTMLRAAGELQVRYTGYALWPFLQNGEIVRITASAQLKVGELVVVDAGGWPDIRRIVAHSAADCFATGLDAFPSQQETVPRNKIFAVVQLASPLAAALSPHANHSSLWGRLAQLRHQLRRIEEGAHFVDNKLSVREKYADQVTFYSQQASQVGSHHYIALEGIKLPRGARILVAGCGAGAETIALAHAGFQVVGVDFVPAMIAAARVNAERAGVSAHFLEGDLTALALDEKDFDLIYFTAFLYSFLSGKKRRVQALATLANYLRPGGSVHLSAKIKAPSKALRPTLAWLYAALLGHQTEWGDWYTWYLSAKGNVEKSYSHTFFSPGQIEREARRAGFQSIQRTPKGHFVLSNFAKTRSEAH